MMTKGSRKARMPIPTKPRSRSVPDVAVLNSQPRFLRSCSLSTNVFQGASFGIHCLQVLVRIIGKFTKA